ncbi:MAG: DNA ligase [Chromatiales bacterium]|nr:DNA ligase [Gammaproteobacteria bacterium]MCP5352732.1 DNA ligase [Chromatiales bacterium]
MKRIGVLLLTLLSLNVHAAPELLQLSTPDDATDCPPGWLLSEKLDGVRAWWDGKRLLSRNGNPFAAPDWFTAALPPFELDGELWSGRGEFERIASIVTRDQPHEGWRAIGYHIFEVPHADGGLPQRLARLRDWLDTHPSAHLHIIEQTPCLDRAHLLARWNAVEAAGGEGLVLRDPDLPYTAGRHPGARKLKRFTDMEARVVGHIAGNGRLRDSLGALLVELPDGRRLRIGTGFSDAERAAPPPVGASVSFKHQGFTASGLPRFPVFLRVRPGDT